MALNAKSIRSNLVCAVLGASAVVLFASGERPEDPTFRKRDVTVAQMTPDGILVIDEAGLSSIVKPDGKVICVGSEVLSWGGSATINLRRQDHVYVEIPDPRGGSQLAAFQELARFTGKPIGASLNDDKKTSKSQQEK